MERAMSTRGPSHEERSASTANGFVAIVLGLAFMVGGAWMLWRSLTGGFPAWGQFTVGMLVLLLGVLTLACLYSLQPNEAAILQLFGAYQGTSRTPGLRATIPFYTRRKISLRARNLNGDKLKVTTSAAIRSRSRPSLCGMWRIRPRPRSTSTITRCS